MIVFLLFAIIGGVGLTWIVYHTVKEWFGFVDNWIDVGIAVSAWAVVVVYWLMVGYVACTFP